jgi:hypothetical protein
MKALLLATMVLLPYPVQANQPLKLHIPGSANGITFRLSSIVKDGLEQRGWTVDLKALGNCLLAKNLADTTTEPFMTYWGNDQNIDPNDKCYLPVPKPDQMVRAFAASPYYLCVREDSKISAQDILSGKDELKLTVTPDPSLNLAFKLLTKHTGATKYKAITYKNSADAVNAFVAGEVDVYMGTAGKEVMKNNKAKCFYNTGPTELEGTLPLREVLKANINLQLVSYYMGRNLSSKQMTKLRADLHEIMETSEWKAATARYKLLDLSTDEEIKYINDSIANHR